MQADSAKREDAVDLAKDMGMCLPKYAAGRCDQTATGRTEWTRAVCEYFNKKYSEPYGWKLYPESEPVKGRVAGEFMTDFASYGSRRTSDHFPMPR